MPYIGRDLNRGNYLKLDDISSSFNSSTKTFNLTVGGSAFTPGSAFSILVSVGGVIQEPESAYQVNNSEITFANAPTAQDSFFCIALATPLGIGVPGSGTVNGPQMAKPFNYDGFFYLNDGTNRVGINSSVPSVALDVSGTIKASSFSGSLVGNTNITSGLSTFYDLRVSNNLTVEGATTTLDTNLIGVDRVEVGANSNSTVGVAITQSGTANLVNLYDGAKQVVTIDDEGNIGIGTGILHTGGAHSGIHQLTVTGQNPSISLGVSNTDQLYIRRELANGKYTFQTNQGGGNNGVISLQPYGGNVGIASGSPGHRLDVVGTIRSHLPNPTLLLQSTQSSGAYTLRMHLGDASTFAKGSIIYEQESGGENYLRFKVGGNTGNNIERLTIQGSGTGNVGIGSAIPSKKLDVVGDTLIQGQLTVTRSTHPQIIIKDSDTTGANDQNGISFVDAANTQYGFIGQTSSAGHTMLINTTNTINPIRLQVNSSTKLEIGHTGVYVDNANFFVNGGYNSYLSGELQVADKIIHRGDEDTQLRFHEADKFRIELGGVTSAFSGLKSTSGAAHARWGINVATPAAVLHIDEVYNHQGLLRVTNGNQNSGYYHQLEMSGTNNVFTLWRHFDGSSMKNTHAHGATGHRWFIDGDERARIDSNGRVGIGTNSPAEQLHIEHDSYFQILLKRVGSGPSEVSIGNEGNYANISNNASGVKFSVGSTPESKMVVRPVGVGIGTLNPRGDFHINDNNPALVFSESDAAADHKYWRTHINGQTWTWSGLNDSYVSGNNTFRMTRSSQQLASFEGMNAGSTWFTIRNTTKRVGIGTNLPTDPLQISVAGGQREPMLRLHHYGQRNFYIQGQWGSTDVGGSNGILQYVDGGGIGFRSGATGLAHLIVSNSGKVGIHTQDPSVNLHAYHSYTTNASVSWGADCGQIFRNEGSELAFGLQNSSPFPFYIQARTNANSARQLTLNPAGGAVAVGTINSFSRTFQVKGNIASLSSSQVTNLTLDTDDGGNATVSSYKAEGSNLYFRTNYSGVGVQNRLHISGNGESSFYGTSAGNPLGITIRNQNTANYSHARLRLESQNAAKYANIYADVPNDALRLEYNSSASIYIKSDGKLGIGTATPQAALHVVGSGNIRVDDGNNHISKTNSNVLTDGAGNPYLSGTPWFTAGTYAYNTSNSPSMDYYWIKIVESLGYSAICYIEYMSHSDSNYPRSVHGRIDVAKYANASVSISHQTITPQTGITPELVVDSNQRVWIRMNGAQWNSDFRFRVIYSEGTTINTTFTVGTDNTSASTGRMLNQDAQPLNVSGIIESGATMRWDLSNSNPPKYWSGSNTSTTAGTYGDSAQTYSSGQAKFFRIGTRGRVDIKADHQNHALNVQSNYIGVNNPAQPTLALFKSQKGTVIEVNRMYTQGILIQFRQNNDARGYIENSGTTTFIVQSGSDERLKKNFEDWDEEVLPYFKALKPKKFNFKEEPDNAKKTKGYIAQDNLDKFPEAYRLNPNDDRYWFANSEMVPYLMKALQEEIVKREEIEAKYNALEARISALESDK